MRALTPFTPIIVRAFAEISDRINRVMRSQVEHVRSIVTAFSVRQRSRLAVVRTVSYLSRRLSRARGSPTNASILYVRSAVNRANNFTIRAYEPHFDVPRTRGVIGARARARVRVVQIKCSLMEGRNSDVPRISLFPALCCLSVSATVHGVSEIPIILRFVSHTRVFSDMRAPELSDTLLLRCKKRFAASN